MKYLSSLIPTIRKFFEPFPRISKEFLQPFVPFLAWYALLQAVVQIVAGVRDLSWSFHYGNLPRMFANFLDVPPAFFFISGALAILAGVLYLTAFPALSDKSKRYQGWEKWVTAAIVLTAARLFETLFVGGGVFWFLVSTTVGWYLIFEFERVIKGSSSKRKTARKRSSTKKRRKKS